MNSKEIIVQCEPNSIKINGKQLSFPLHLNTLIDIFGEPKQERDTYWYFIWDELGIYGDYGSWDDILNINFLIKKVDIKHLPQNTFSGKIFVNDNSINDVEETTIKLNSREICKWRYKDDNEIYAYNISENYDYEEINLKDKYKLPKPSKDSIVFADFNFKLSVIEELMFNQKVLTPEFDVYEFVEVYSKRKIDIDKEGYEIIPEVLDYFEKLVISKKMLEKVTEINQEGGNKIYTQLCPFWDGEDNLFNIKSFEDVKHLQKLKRMNLFYKDEKIVEELKLKGIEVG
jgi:virulence-associated protein VapD